MVALLLRYVGAAGGGTFPRFEPEVTFWCCSLLALIGGEWGYRRKGGMA